MNTHESGLQIALARNTLEEAEERGMNIDETPRLAAIKLALGDIQHNRGYGSDEEAARNA